MPKEHDDVSDEDMIADVRNLGAAADIVSGSTDPDAQAIAAAAAERVADKYKK